MGRAHPEEGDESHAVRLRVLERGHEVLVDQIASLTVDMRAVATTQAVNAAALARIEASIDKNTEMTAIVRDAVTLGRASKWLFKAVGAAALLVTSMYGAWLVLKDLFTAHGR